MARRSAPRLEQVRGEGMPQRVRTDHRNACCSCDVPRHQPLNAAPGQSSAARIHEQRMPPAGVLRLGSSRLASRDRSVYHFRRLFSVDLLNGTMRSLRPLPMTRTIRPERSTSSRSSADELAQADTRRVEQLENGPIAATERRRDIRRLQQLRHLVDAEMRRHLLFPLRRDRQHRRIGIDQAFAAQVTGESPQRGQLARDRRARLSLTIQLAKISADHVEIEVPGLRASCRRPVCSPANAMNCERSLSYAATVCGDALRFRRM